MLSSLSIHPIALWLLLIYGGYVLFLWRWPQTWLPILLAALPVLDFAPWTGQFFFDEFDLLLLLTVITVLARRGLGELKNTYFGMTTTATALFWAVGLAGLVATIMGAWPFPALDSNSFNNYYSPYNALRVGKGLGFALLLLPLLAGDLQRDADKTFYRIAFGMSLGVLGAGLAVAWERISMTGLWNFHSGYRVVGLFSGMHTGGAYIEAYFATAMPFVLWWGIHSRHWALKLSASLIFLIACYAMLVTYARGGYLALILASIVLLAGMLPHRSVMQRMRHIFITMLVLLLIGVGLWFSLINTPMHWRAGNMQRDMNLRVAHWHQILDIMDQGLPVKLFGMGQGRLPGLYVQRVPAANISEYRFMREDEHNYLHLTGGDPLYFEQVVDVQPDKLYILKIVVRSKDPNAELYLPLCQKWMLYPEQCLWKVVKPGDATDWQTFTLSIDTKQLRDQSWHSRAPRKLSLVNFNDGSVIDIASVSLRAPNGDELIANGDFAQGMQNWFFSTENHLPWHFKNLALQLYFEQGWFGLILMSALLIYSAVILVRRADEKAFPAALLASALIGFLTVGMVDSLFDFPRMSIVFYLLVLLIHLREKIES
ncbi:O-antigen ligase family protein [Solimicrobium silvestre]|uniref:O-antigen ligase like membrane protein n=1 Tax=Solimicrobium silvestre TaxID=2099400 RepID=A0A2S9H0P7_9BURK|nr:O-antigen ligase family protein [Solimicrobium silvestre]PRC93520.1 O-antigen ligase like membrane protein [Solimicrobium silvestre]